VGAEIKFCGLTRAEDAHMAALLGASYVGVIFAGGPREVTPDHATSILATIPRSVRRVGVFANQSAVEIHRIVDSVGLDIVQLHGDGTEARMAELRRLTAAAIWPVVRVSRSLPAGLESLIDASDGLLLDAFSPKALGGTGVSFDWAAIAAELEAIRGELPIILAGGLRPENVGDAVAALSPDIVDVSSGVESSPGIKDHKRMRAFRDAVLHASISP
jgi:phosphoribosylanthranilate isomerase